MSQAGLGGPQVSAATLSISPDVMLSTEQRESFEANGFLAIPEITTAGELAWMREIYDQLFDRRAGWETGDFFDFSGRDDESQELRLPQLLNPSRYVPALARTIFRANAEAIARQLLGQRAKLIFEHAMMKPALTGGETAWHQDAAFYARLTNYRAITIWMPLQPVDGRNGCMEFIPGSHRRHLVAHRHVDGDPRIHGLEATGVEDAHAVPCHLPAGGATIHTDRTLHHAGANRSNDPRRAYALVFGVHGREYLLKHDHAWNTQGRTAREERLTLARGPIEKATAILKNVVKSVIRR